MEVYYSVEHCGIKKVFMSLHILKHGYRFTTSMLKSSLKEKNTQSIEKNTQSTLDSVHSPFHTKFQG